MLINLYDAETDELIGSITEAELEFLTERLEETSDSDQDYYIDGNTIEFLADGEATDHLVELLKKALGSKDGVDIRWEEKE